MRKDADIADQFETMIYRMMLKEMRKTIPTEEGLFGDSQSMGMYMDIVDDHMAAQLSGNNSLGIDTLIYNELKQRNDQIADDEDLKEKPAFMPLETPEPEAEREARFVPLETSTERFLQLHQKPEMMDLPRQKEKYLPISEHPRLSSDRISNLDSIL